MEKGTEKKFAIWPFVDVPKRPEVGDEEMPFYEWRKLNDAHYDAKTRNRIIVGLGFLVAAFAAFAASTVALDLVADTLADKQ